LENSRDSKKRYNPESPIYNEPYKRQKIHRESSCRQINDDGRESDVDVKRNFVSITEFNKVLNELINIKTSFNEVSKKLDAVMKI
jgi:hypothetical protein